MILPRRRVASLLLALLLIAGPLAAATHRPHEVWQSRLSVTGLLSEAWDLMSRIFGRAGSSTFLFEKEGSSNDPFGKSGSSGDPFGKEGSSGDPFGKSGSSNDPFGKAGSQTDPFGNPKPTSQPGDSTSAELASGK
jgi:hypothetical protein